MVDTLRRETRIHLFHSRRYNKWNLFEILGRDPAFHHHLPETVQVEGPQEVMEMVRRGF